MCVVAVGCGSPCTRPTLLLAPPPHPPSLSLGASWGEPLPLGKKLFGRPQRTACCTDRSWNLIPTFKATSDHFVPLAATERTVWHWRSLVLAPALGNLGTWIPRYLDTWPRFRLSSFLSNPIQSPPGCILHPSHLDLDPRALLSCPALPCALSSPAPSSPGRRAPASPFQQYPRLRCIFFPPVLKNASIIKLFSSALPCPVLLPATVLDETRLLLSRLPFPSPPPTTSSAPAQSPLTVQTSRYPPLSAHQREPASRRQHVALHLVHPPVRRACHARSSGTLLLGC